jgi:quinol monooxygenase YgiN
MSLVVVAAAFPLPEHRAKVIAAFEAAIARVHGEPGVEHYALHEGPAGCHDQVHTLFAQTMGYVAATAGLLSSRGRSSRSRR